MEKIMNSKIFINLKDGIFSISGSEVFIEKNIEHIKDYIKNNYNSFCNTEMIKVSDNTIKLSDELLVNNDSDKKQKYINAGLFHIDKEKNEIKILKRVPGKSKAEKAKNIAMMLLYIKNTEMSSSEIIPYCVEQACFDQKNFAATFKKLDGYFIKNGKGQGWSLALTIPGREKAEELMDNIINAK